MASGAGETYGAGKGLANVVILALNGPLALGAMAVT